MAVETHMRVFGRYFGARARTGLVHFVLLATLVQGQRVVAHDLWIEPTSFTPERGRVVGLRLRVGQDFVGDPVPRDPGAIEEFVSASAAGVTAVPGRDGADPAGLVRPAERGLLVIGYRTRPFPIELPAEKFNQYLADEGLEAVQLARARAGQAAKPARELFSRCAKSLLQAGPVGRGDVDRTLGMRLELVAGNNPYAMHAGQSLGVQLLYEGQPLPNALVVALHRRDPGKAVRLRTDRNGRVRIPLGAAGSWLVKAVHMIPAPPDSGAEWQSFWASLTFELPVGTVSTSGTR
jgi:uncharacterized GH25 family protein